MTQIIKTACWFTVITVATAWIALGGVWVDVSEGVAGRVEKSQDVTFGGRVLPIQVSAQVLNIEYCHCRPLLVSSMGSKLPACVNVALASDDSDSFASVCLLEGSLTLDKAVEAEMIEGRELERVSVPEAFSDHWRAAIELPLTQPSDAKLTLTFRVQYKDGDVQDIPLTVPITKIESATRFKPGWTGFYQYVNRK